MQGVTDSWRCILLERLQRYCGLWCVSAPRAPPAGKRSVHDPDGDWDSWTASAGASRELTYVDIDTLDATF
jgi:hypothetical protein